MTRDPFRRPGPDASLASRIARRLAPAAMLGAHGPYQPGAPESLLRIALMGPPLQLRIAPRVAERAVAAPAPPAPVAEMAGPQAAPSAAPPLSDGGAPQPTAEVAPARAALPATPAHLPFSVEQVRAALEQPRATPEQPRIETEQAQKPSAASTAASLAPPAPAAPRSVPMPPASAPTRPLMRRAQLQELPTPAPRTEQPYLPTRPAEVAADETERRAPGQGEATPAPAGAHATTQPATVQRTAPPVVASMPVDAAPSSAATPLVAPSPDPVAKAEEQPSAAPPAGAHPEIAEAPAATAESPASTEPVLAAPPFAMSPGAPPAPAVRRAAPGAEIGAPGEPPPMPTPLAEGEFEPPAASPVADMGAPESADLRREVAAPGEAVPEALASPVAADVVSPSQASERPILATPEAVARTEHPPAGSPIAPMLGEPVPVSSEAGATAAPAGAKPTPLTGSPAVQRATSGQGAPAPTPPDLGARYRAALDDYRRQRATAPSETVVEPDEPEQISAPPSAPPGLQRAGVASALAAPPTSSSEPAAPVEMRADLPPPEPQPVPLEQALFGEPVIRRAATEAAGERSVRQTAPAPEPMAPVQVMQRAVEQASTDTEQSAESAPPAESGQKQEVDINRLAEQVYQRLRRRLQIEAERLGWSGRP